MRLLIAALCLLSSFLQGEVAPPPAPLPSQTTPTSSATPPLTTDAVVSQEVAKKVDALKNAEEEKTFILPEGEVHVGDLFVMANSVEISGTVKGDAYILATQIFIDGKIEGDVLAAGGSIEIAGNVENNIRLLGGQVLVSGNVARNSTIVGANVQTTSFSSMAGNAVFVAGNAELGSTMGREVTLIASNARLVGKIQGNIYGFIGQLRLTSRAVINGTLEYNSDTPAWIDPNAKIVGQVIYHPSFVSDIIHGNWVNALLFGSKIAALLMNFLYTFFIGVLLIRYFHHNLKTTLDAVSLHPLKSLFIGIMLLVALPLASLLLLMTILGVPFALTLIALNVISFYTAKTYTIIWASNMIFKKLHMKPNKVSTFALGLVAYFLITSIPIVGGIIALATMLLGIGAGVLAQAPKKALSR